MPFCRSLHERLNEHVSSLVGDIELQGQQAAVQSQVDDERWLLLEQSVVRGLARFEKMLSLISIL
jgi:hypothetical protein